LGQFGDQELGHLLRVNVEPRFKVKRRQFDVVNCGVAVTIYGVLAVTFMMTMYALERRGRRYILGFALGCALSSIYGFLSGAWPFGVVELIWSGVAVQRFRTERD
jgi:hypothetical protein